MLYFDADPRDGAPAGSVCNACCCLPLSLRRGETNMVTVNYAAWSVPIAPPGLVTGFDYSIDLDTSACLTSAVDGFLPPNNAYYSLVTLADQTLAINLAASVTPALNTFSFTVDSLSGPASGSLIRVSEGVYNYIPAAGFQGWDHFWYTTIDGQGRRVTRSVIIRVGNAIGLPPAQWAATKPYIDRTKVTINARMQTVSFPIYMPPSCQGCNVYRLNIKQPAQDCDRTTYVHLSCYDIRCRDCN